MIMIGCPVQNREQVIDRYLDAILKLDYPKKDIHLNFLLNNSTDNTIYRLMDFFFDHMELDDYGIVEVNVYDDVDYTDSIYQRDYGAFAKIRNKWLEFLDPEDTHFFSIDSDVLPPAQSLNQLLNHDKDIISILVKNGPSAYNVCNYDGRTGYYKSVYPLKRKLMQVDLTGACYLVKREVVDAGVRWGDAIQSEDVYFSEQAREQGFELWSDGTMEAQHLKWEIHKL